MGEGVAYEGFFLLGYVNRIPQVASPYRCGIVAHFEPMEVSDPLEMKLQAHTGEDRVLSSCLTHKIFNFDRRWARPIHVDTGEGKEWYGIIPGREKSLFFLRDKYMKRVTGVNFTPLPAIFDNLEDFRDTASASLPELRAVKGNVQQTGWYLDMLEEVKLGIEDAALAGDLQRVRELVLELHTCFPSEHRLFTHLKDAVKETLLFSSFRDLEYTLDRV